MQKSNPDIWQYIVTFFEKWVPVLFWIVIGIGARLAVYAKKERLSKTQIWVTSVIGFAIGVSAYNLCIAQGWDKAVGYITPIATLSGESIADWLILNVTKILDKKVLNKDE